MVRIVFKDLIIDTVSDTSGIFYGNNYPVRWKNTSKTNGGFGDVCGDQSVTSGNTNVVNDQDFMDVILTRAKDGKGNL